MRLHGMILARNRNRACQPCSKPKLPMQTSPQKLPLVYFYVAGLGRRKIGDRGILRKEVSKVLLSVAEAVPEAEPIAVASGASGADQVFLEAALDLQWRIRLVLPTPPEFFEKDFTTSKEIELSHEVFQDTTDIEGLNAFRRLRDEAIDVEVIAPCPSRRDAFTRCAETIVRSADVVLAIWNAGDGRQGGTNESLLLAEYLDVPIVLLNSESGERIRSAPSGDKGLRRIFDRRNGNKERPAGILHDVQAALRVGLQHKDGRKPGPVLRSWSDELMLLAPAEQGRAFGNLLANRADNHAKRHRNLNFTIVGLNLFAVAVGILDQTMRSNSQERVGMIAPWIELISVFSAICLILWVRRLRSEEHWVRARFIRELNRSLIQTIHVSKVCGTSVGGFVPSAIWAVFQRLKLPLVTFHAITSRGEPTKALVEVIADYRMNRLYHRDDCFKFKSEDALRELSQYDYHLLEGEKAVHLHRLIKAAFWGVTVTLFACEILSVFLANIDSKEQGFIYRLVKLATLLLPVVSASLLVMPNLLDNHRRRIVSPALCDLLKSLDRESIQILDVLAKTNPNNPTPISPTVATGMPVWSGDPETVHRLAEAWAKNRLAGIAQMAETALLTEVIGFKTFNESAEVG